jgi:hypothetical protein
VTFSCDGTIALTQTIAISNTTTLDASGHAVTLSGDQAVRVFRVENPATLSLVNLSIANGMAAGTNGGPSVDGESGEGGAIYNSGTVNALGCLFTNNFAKGGRGGATTNTLGPPNGNGGSASGGAIFNQGGTLNLTNCQLLWNGSYGGTGAVYSLYSIVSSGGAARGGAVSSQGGTARFVDCVFNSNQTKAGPGTRYGIVGAGFGSNAYGGALCSSTGEVWLIRCSVFANTNQATACRDASGGAVYATGGDLRWSAAGFSRMRRLEEMASRAAAPLSYRRGRHWAGRPA